MTSLIQDIRFGLRQMRKNPGFTIAVVLCIALGIGANTATFSVANSLLLPKQMIREPERLIRMYVNWSSGLKFGSFSYLDYADLRDRNDVLEGLAAESIKKFHLSSGDRNEAIVGSIVSGNYFDVVGVRAAMGRTFLPEEDKTEGTHPVVVISNGLWQRRFGGDPGIVGTQIRLSGHPFTIVGVMPEEFTGSNVAIEPEIWVPIMMNAQALPGDSELKDRGEHWLNIIVGRLKPGVSVDQARASLGAVMARLAEEYPDSNKGTTLAVFPETESSPHPMMRSAFVGFMTLMFVVVGAILLLACANVAGLLLARFAGRRREIAIRLSIGAGRGRLLRQLLVESALLSLLAGAFGLLLGVGLVRLIQSVPMPPNIPIKLHVATDTRVLIFTFVVSILTGIVFGLAPALQSIRQNLVTSLKEESTSVGGGISRLRKGLVVTQVALSLILLIVAGLTVRSLQNVRSLDPGFDPDNQIVATLDLDLQGYKEPQGRQFYKSLREKIQSLPGVEAVGFSKALPLMLNSSQRSVIPEGFTTPEGQNDPSIDYSTVDHGYFAAMGVPILLGRGFNQTDNADSLPVIVINQKFADRFWPGQDPIGKRVRTAGKDHQVIGVTPTGRYFTLGEDPKPFFYLNWEQHYRGEMVVHVRSKGDPLGLLEPVRQNIRSLDGALPIMDLQLMQTAIGFALLPARLAAAAVSGFALLAMLLAAVGLYGVIAYSVSQGTKEMAIRMALGAEPSQVLRLVVRKGMILTGIGLVIGVIGGTGLSILMQGLLYGVSAIDPLAYIGAMLLLGSITFLASWLPARRTLKIDPLTALRYE